MEDYYGVMDSCDGSLDGKLSADSFATVAGTEIPRGDNSFAKQLGFDSYSDIPEKLQNNIKADKDGNKYIQISGWTQDNYSDIDCPWTLMNSLFPNEAYSETKYKALMEACNVSSYPFGNTTQLSLDKVIEFVQSQA